MNKYIVEDGIHFYDELKKSANSILDVEDDRCLISNQALIVDQTVTMECGHKFNYVPLFLDLVNHKRKFNSMERTILKTIEIRCPYCRHIQKNLLPYQDLPGVEKVHGVNYVNDLISLIVQPSDKVFKGKCAYHSLIQQTSGVWETVSCLNNYVLHVDMLDKDYCSFHKYKAIQEYMKQKKVEEKATKKEEAKKQKQLLKLLEKGNSCCKELIKTGKNKGKECGCNVFVDDVCKRHSKKNTDASINQEDNQKI
jgi:hypothetical protein